MPESATRNPRVLVVQNTPAGGLGRFEGWWREAGVEVDIVPAYTGAPIPDLDDHDGLALLGGGLMPDDDERGPWLAREREVTRQALDRAVPVLGICLGGQLLAHVAGGTVRADHGEPEAGSTRLITHEPAGQDPLFADLTPTFLATEHHVDQITEVPPGAVLLASSERCPIQAFRVGDSAWGVQFHPEIDVRRVQAWDRDRLIEQGFDPDEVVRRAAADEPITAPIWRTFAERFAAVVRSGTSVRTH
ncbi:type 1 glutamine amidotransferase [Microlunatus speluncae]|uniref:type 1 glutamine amidotransferase n=1 Tax=Microlunatus speluncae TaxID=2594267 RepID=UPI0012665BE2|nr:type 1 glutamine amidotransferase [Microlunatus speluncae]